MKNWAGRTVAVVVMAGVNKVQSSEFKVQPSPQVLRRDKNFVRYAQHKINWIATRRLRSLAMTEILERLSLRVKRSNPVNKPVRHSAHTLFEL